MSSATANGGARIIPETAEEDTLAEDRKVRIHAVSEFPAEAVISPPHISSTSKTWLTSTGIVCLP